MKKLLITLALVVLPVSAVHAMTVAAFLDKADALQRRGMMAMFSSDIGLLKNEIRSSAQVLRAESDAARRSGRRPVSCPPTPATLTSTEILAHLRAIPAPQRQRLEVRDALRPLFARKFPCR